MKNCIFLAIITLVFLSCKETRTLESEEVGVKFYFDNPQPIDDSELDHFPSRFTGTYAFGEMSFLKIESDRIIQESNYKLPVAKNQLDSLKQLGSFSNGKFIIDGESYSTIDDGDTIYIIDKSVETLFRLSADQKLKRINGHLVLTEKDSTFWQVSVLSIEKDSLHWKTLFKTDDIPKLQELVKSFEVGDTTIMKINPTRKEFRKILDQKQFGWKTSYKKVR